MDIEKRSVQLARLRTTEAHQEALKEASRDLNSLEIGDIGLIDGTEFARALKRYAHLMPKSGKFIEMPELVAFICEIIRRMPQFKKGV